MKRRGLKKLSVAERTREKKKSMCYFFPLFFFIFLPLAFCRGGKNTGKVGRDWETLQTHLTLCQIRSEQHGLMIFLSSDETEMHLNF